MSIKIIEEPEITLTRDEHDRLQREWQASQSMTTSPQTFEQYVRSQKSRADESGKAKTGIAAGLIGLALLALVAQPTSRATERRPKYDWVDHVSGLSAIDKLVK